MKTLLAVIALAFSTGSVFADHTKPTPISNPKALAQALTTSVHQLEETVRHSTLRYDVQQSVFAFAYDVEVFGRCMGVRSALLALTTDAGQAADDHGGTGALCLPEIQRAQSSFYQVDRYLYDTDRDYPSVFRAYRLVKDNLARMPR